MMDQKAIFSRLITLYEQFVQELDIEYDAIQDDQIARLISSQHRQNALQSEIDSLRQHLHEESEQGRHIAEKASIEKIEALISSAREKIERNQVEFQKHKENITASLKELGNFRRIYRKLFPQKMKKNTPVFLDIRR